MSKKRRYPGKLRRRHVYLTPAHSKVADQLDNFSAFVRLAIDMAPSIMAWAIMQRDDPEQYGSIEEKPIELYLDEYNRKYPNEGLDKPIGAAPSTPSSQKNPELW